TVSPTSEGRAPSSEKSAWLSTTAGGAPGRLSPASKPRPNAGRTPSTSKSAALARIAGKRRGEASRAVRSRTSSERNAATPLNPGQSGERYRNSLSDQSPAAQKRPSLSSAG